MIKSLQWASYFRLDVAQKTHARNVRSGVINDVEYRIAREIFKRFFHRKINVFQSNIIAILQYAKQKSIKSPRHTSFSWAFRNGYLYVLEYLYNECNETKSFGFAADIDTGISVATLYGYLEIVKFLCKRRMNTSRSHVWIDGAASNGHLAIVAYLHGIGYKCSYRAILGAAENGYLDVIKYLHTHKAEYNHVALREAILNNHLDIVKYLYETVKVPYRPWTEHIIDQLAQKGQLEMIKYMHTTLKESHSWQALVNAAERGHLKTVKYLCKVVHCTKSTWALERAAFYGHFAIVRYLLQVQNIYPMGAINAAAAGGHYDIVVYLRYHGADYSHQAIISAVRNNHVDIVRFFTQPGSLYLPWVWRYLKLHKFNLPKQIYVHRFPINLDKK